MENVFEFLKFGIVGLMNTIISIVIYWVLLRLNINFLVANIISYSLGVINSYYFNSRWVFSSTNERRSTLLKFIIVNLIVLVITTNILKLLVDSININPYLAQLFTVAIGMVINFILNKFWTFKVEV